MTRRPPFDDLDTLLAWLQAQPPVRRVHLARLLANTQTTGAVAHVGDAVVYDMTRTASRTAVADLLGTSVGNVQRAITRHIKHTGAERRRGPERTVHEEPPPTKDADRPSESYGERKPYTVADNLDDLRGPTVGVVTLPHHIDWSGSPQRDLDADGELFTLYPTVLAEASTVADLNAWLDKATLVRFWPNLFLPAKIRRIWEERFPELAATRTPKPPRPLAP